MFSRQYYPLFLSLEDKQCLVVGYGAVGARKLAGLLKCGARNILVLDISSLCVDEEFFRTNSVRFEKRKCDRKDVQDSFIVFITTNDMAENRRISMWCREEKTLCNSASEPKNGNFIVPALVRAGDIGVAISTGGASPVLAAQCRRELEGWARSKAKLGCFLGKLRPVLLKLHHGSAMVKKFFEKACQSSLGEWLENNQEEKCMEWLEENLPPETHEKIKKILTEQKNDFS